MNNTPYEYKNYSPACADASEIWQKVIEEPILYQRSPDFSKLINQINMLLQNVTNFLGCPFLITSSGTGALECAIASAKNIGNALVVVNGYFGERIYEICKFHGLNPTRYDLPIDIGLQTDHEDDLIEIIQEKGIRLFLGTHVETATGIKNDISILGSLSHRYGGYSIIDGISALGGVPCDLKNWNIDCYVAVSYKCLMTPAGLSIILASDDFLDKATNHWSYYFDLKRLKKNFSAQKYLWSPPLLSLTVLKYSIESIMSIGPQEYFKLIEKKANIFRKNLINNGLTLIGDSKSLSPCFSTISLKTPAAPQILDTLYKNYFIDIAAGIGNNSSKYLRIGHYPNRSEDELLIFSNIISDVLKNEDNY